MCMYVWWPGIPPSEEDRKAARLKRFGIEVAPKTGAGVATGKVGTVVVDESEAERRKKRLERFGLPNPQAEVSSAWSRKKGSGI